MEPPAYVLFLLEHRFSNGIQHSGSGGPCILLPGNVFNRINKSSYDSSQQYEIEHHASLIIVRRLHK